MSALSEFFKLFYFVIGRYMVGEARDGPLMSMSLRDFVLNVGARSPSPGGGSVAALSATMVRKSNTGVSLQKVLIFSIHQVVSFS